MKKLTHSRKILASTIMVITILFFVSCSKKSAILPPFMPNDGISATLEKDIETEPSGMTGDQDIFIVWKLDATEHQIDAATSDTQVRDKLYWLKSPSNRLSKTLDFFSASKNYQKIHSEIADVLADPDVRYAYMELFVSKGNVAFASNEVEYASMWICSPKAKKIAFLCSD